MKGGPSSLYRADVWRLGQWAVKVLPARVCEWACWSLAAFYWRFNGQRRRTVIANLGPALNGDHAKAAALSRELFKQFALKIADLWRYESGESIEHLVQEWSGWENFVAAQKSGRGILLLTAHLGNWELGAPLLARHGVKLLVVTLLEPHAGLTELRKESRSRWGVETLVIGEDAFAFVEIIRRLDRGETVALLVDRPPASSATTVRLFGRPFLASMAAAELARATGCALLPVYLPRAGHCYRARMLPEVPYHRAALRSRESREQLTQEIMRTFEPIIREHLSQWYHFVPIWPDDGAKPLI
jgi:lauroyl/myristoyl acyltransferase